MKKIMFKIIFALLIMPLWALAETPESQPTPYTHTIAITLGGGLGSISEMYGLEYEFQFLPSWSINATQMEGKELWIRRDEFKAIGLSIKKSMELSKTWSLYASLGVNKHKSILDDRSSFPPVLSRAKGNGALVSVGLDGKIFHRFLLGVQLLKIDLGKYPGGSSINLRLSYRF